MAAGPLHDKPEEVNPSVKPHLMARVFIDPDENAQPSETGVEVVLDPDPRDHDDHLSWHHPQFREHEPNRRDAELQSALSEVSVLTIHNSGRHLLRGVSLKKLLPFLRAGPHSLVLADVLYEQSGEVGHITYFISHPWSASSKQKWMSLCLVFNMVPFVVAIVVGQLIVGCAYMFHLLPNLHFHGNSVALWNTTLVAAMAIIAALQGHRLPSVFRGNRERMFFFDYLCIHQGNEVLKTEATYAIAAIAARSERMLILWDPAFFERLWCVLEVAAIIYSRDQDILARDQDVANWNKRGSPVIFVPLFTTEAAFRCFCASWLLTIGVQFVPISLAWLVYMCAGVYMFFTASRYVRSLDVLTKQLEGFSVSQAKCSVMDDREILVGTIVNWFGSIERFEAHVKTTVLQHVLERCRTDSAMSYQWMAVAFVPIMLSNTDGLCHFLRDTEYRHNPLALFILYLNCLLMLILSARCFLFLASITHRVGRGLPPSCARSLDVLGGVFASVSAAGAAGAIGILTLVDESLALPIVVFVCLFLFVIRTHFQRRLPRCQRRPDRNSRPAEAHVRAIAPEVHVRTIAPH